MLAKTSNGRTIDTDKVRRAHGIGSLLGSSTKVEKGSQDSGSTIAILYLSPGSALWRHLQDPDIRELIGEDIAAYFETHYHGGIKTMCPMAGACEAACLAEFSGLMKMKRNAAVRARRTMLLLLDREAFGALLRQELEAWATKARRAGLEPVLRLNGGSDLDWDYLFPWLADFLRQAGIRRYEYTKVASYIRRNVERGTGVDYTFSRDTVDEPVIEALELGARASVVFDLPVQIKRGGKVVRQAGTLPKTWNGFKVISGDEHDRRWEDEHGVVVGLRVKGGGESRAAAVASGFAVAA